MIRRQVLGGLLATMLTAAKAPGALYKDASAPVDLRVRDLALAHDAGGEGRPDHRALGDQGADHG
jgi:hypothetical protein